MSDVKDPIEIKELSIEEVLNVILRPLQISFGICFIILTGLLLSCLILGGKPGDSSFQTDICEVNTCFLSLKVYGVLYIISLLSDKKIKGVRLF